ncbi:MAG: hypothetical protein GKS06_19890 [Acidobacteria bacterium]|nr:hypothetical protein [Acidobacteriota bacterium]
MKHRLVRRPTALVLSGIIATSLSLHATSSKATETQVNRVGFMAAAGQQIRKIELPSAQTAVPQDASRYLFTAMLQLFGASPQLAGSKATNGKVNIRYQCFDTPPTQGSMRAKLRDGNAIVSMVMDQDTPCFFFRATPDLSGRAPLPMAANGTFSVSVVPLPDNAGCTPDTNTLCLMDGRFESTVRWSDGGKNNHGNAFLNGPDSGIFYFFNPENTEMLVKVLDGCGSPTNSFWVFAAAATDVEYNLTVTDTETGQSKTYGNALGNPAPAIVDTQAFATCP